MTRLEQVAESLMQPINPSMILILGVYTILWGLWLLAPWWSVFAHGVIYVQMANIAPEWAWGIFAIISSLFTLRGAFKPNYMNLHLGSFAAAMFWLIISIMYFIADWHATGGLTALCFFAYSSIVFINVKVNKHIYERK